MEWQCEPSLKPYRRQLQDLEDEIRDHERSRDLPIQTINMPYEGGKDPGDMAFMQLRAELHDKKAKALKQDLEEMTR